jgi:hypothetical protein
MTPPLLPWWTNNHGRRGGAKWLTWQQCALGYMERGGGRVPWQLCYRKKNPKIVMGFNFSSSKHLVYRTLTFHDIY